MDDFIKILIFHLNTTDNIQDSANFIRQHIEQVKLANDKRLRFKVSNYPETTKILSEQEKFKIQMTTVFKYKLMKIRSKISFIARKLRMTISEMILNQIHTSYMFLIKHSEIQKNKYDEYISRDDIFEKFLGSGSSSIFRFIMHINAHCSSNKDDQKRLAR